ncbi:LytTR family DNA-binding domain-containing protein [Streptococcus pneumoniae]
MNIQIHIDPHLSQEEVHISIRELNKEWEDILNLIHKMKTPKLTAHRGKEIHFLDIKDIFHIVTENKVVLAKTENQTYQLEQPLYQLIDLLPKTFLQISQSEIINSEKIRSLEFTKNGLVKIFLTNGTYTFSSRRYLKSIKEALNL